MYTAELNCFTLGMTLFQTIKAFYYETCDATVCSTLKHLALAWERSRVLLDLHHSGGLCVKCFFFMVSEKSKQNASRYSECGVHHHHLVVNLIARWVVGWKVQSRINQENSHLELLYISIFQYPLFVYLAKIFKEKKK